MECMAGTGQLDLDGAAVVRAAFPLGEAVALDRIQVAGESRALDPDRAGKLELRSPRFRFQRVQDQPDRQRAALLPQCVVERTADRLRRRRENESERGLFGAHQAIVESLSDSILFVTELLVC